MHSGLPRLVDGPCSCWGKLNCGYAPYLFRNRCGLNSFGRFLQKYARSVFKISRGYACDAEIIGGLILGFLLLKLCAIKRHYWKFLHSVST